MASGIESPAQDPGQPAASRAGDRPRVGGRLGRHELVDVLGHGAMASVFRARDTHLGREVAIKVMNLATAARADAGERFRREAHAVAALKHPAVVEIFDFVAATDDEPAYIVSELIDGPTLRKFLEEHEGRLLPEVAALLLLPLCEALAAAHARGIVHRDLKPDNVMIDRTGGACRVVLTDFGVAHVAGLETMTATGALVGSPAYMAPEQARGQDVGRAADLWALGAMFYELVVGRVPFPGHNPIVVLAAIARGQYQRAGQIAATVGASCERLIARCLKLEVTERFADAQAIATELRALLAEAGITEEGAALKRFLQDPTAFEHELRPQVAERALTRARQHARRGELARALAEIGRATAYVPGHAGAERLLATLATRKRWLTIAGAVAGAGLLVAGGLAAARAWRGNATGAGGGTTGRPNASARGAPAPQPAARPPVPASAPPVATAPPPTRPAGSAPPLQPTAAAPADEARAAEAEKGEPKAAGSSRRSRGERRASGKGAASVATATQAGRGTPSGGPPARTAAAEPTAPPAAAEPTAPPNAAPPAPAHEPAAPGPAVRSPAPSPGTVSVTLSARFGNCYPALDSGAPSARPMLELADAKPGRHAVYCSEDPLAEKALVGHITIPEPPAGVKVHHSYLVDKPVDGKRKVRLLPTSRAP